jgi:hypothetical protein
VAQATQLHYFFEIIDNVQNSNTEKPNFVDVKTTGSIRSYSFEYFRCYVSGQRDK